MKVFPINTGHFKLDGGAMFGVVPKVIWNKLNPADENNLCNWAMRSLLIDTGQRRILIDTGIGNKQDEKFMGHYHLNGPDSLEGNLARYGYSRGDITDVLLTHLHFDHCGGCIEQKAGQLVPAFENATFWSNERHWQWATRPNAREKASFLKENILPIEESGRLKMVPVAEKGTVPFDDVPGISIRFAFGHTDAMMCPQVEINGRTLVFMADLLPSPAHIPLPYVMGYDMFPLKTLEEKKAFLEEAVAGNYLLFYQHDPAIEAGELVMTEKGIRSGKTGSL
ncbi:MAG: MBL fold metallo-hydrolase, partial [Chitinophagaceae bacterium]|nr:MBL fold metallo-hydrolase [Chitinophagaceae bacterium]